MTLYIDPGLVDGIMIVLAYATAAVSIGLAVTMAARPLFSSVVS